MADFDIEFDKVIKAEGGYVNDPNDNGGETYLGISRKFNPNWSMWKLIDDVKRKYGTKGITNRLKSNSNITNHAKSYYKANYWDVLELDDIPNQKIAHQLFDTSVNMGVSVAISIARYVTGMSAKGGFDDNLKYNLMHYES